MKKAKPKASKTQPPVDHVAPARAELRRAEALLDCLRYCLNYHDAEEEVDIGHCCTLADMACELVASAEQAMSFHAFPCPPWEAVSHASIDHHNTPRCAVICASIAAVKRRKRLCCAAVRVPGA